MRRVAITGVGIVCALGGNAAEVWQALAAGRCGIGPITALDTAQLRFHNGAEATDFVPEKHLAGAQFELLDRFAQFALAAAREAVADSSVSLTPGLGARAAVVAGSCVGGQSAQEVGFQDLYTHQRNRVHPLTIPRAMMNAGASAISMDLGVTGPAFTVSTACSSANHAIGLAFGMVRSGQVELAIAGGSEAPFSFGNLKAWEAMRVVSPDTCRPFSRDRSGMVLGEGGAMLVLEPWDAAVARGAHIRGEIVGFGMSADAHHITQPTMAGPVAAMRQAIADAGIAPADIGYINAHGTGTSVNDPVESRAIREVFGDDVGRVLVSSTKSMHGHALGAAGAIEAVATLLALENQLAPPTANFTERDAECDVNVVANRAQAAKFEYALSNSFAFGGLNAVLGFRRAP
jgi:nodulation protein E